MVMRPGVMVRLPYPSDWDIQANIAGRPTRLGILRITGVTNNQVSGAVNFRGTFLPIQGIWEERTRELRFETPYASFAGTLASAEDPQIRLRHYALQGTVRMKHPSIRAGQFGTWTATTMIRTS